MKRTVRPVVVGRFFSTSTTPSTSTAITTPSQLYRYTANPNAVTPDGFNVTTLTRPGGRQSVSGIVATVFGATGFVGRYAVNNLGRIGSQVIVPYRSDGMNARHLRLSGDLGQIVPIPYSMYDEESIRKTLVRSNVAVNLIGSQLESAKYSWDDVHVKIAYRVAKIAKESGVERFIHVSAFGADLKSDSAFLRSKAAGEEVVKSFFPDATILRPTTIFGREDRFINKIASIGQKFIGIPVVRGGEQKIAPVYVADVSRAILASITFADSVGKTYTLAGPEVFTHKELVEMVRVLTHTPTMRTIPLPDNVAHMLGRMIGDRPREFDVQHPIAKQLVDAGRNVYHKVLAMPNVFHSDLVAQSYVDQIVPADALTLQHLGVTPTPLHMELEPILIGHQYDYVDRFQSADRMKKDGAGVVFETENAARRQ